MIKLGSSLAVLLALAVCGCSSDSTPMNPVTISATSPGSIRGNQTDVAWTLTGTGFQTGASVVVAVAGAAISNVSVVSATSITFTMTTDNSTPAGTTTLTVINPDNSTANRQIPTLPATVTLSGYVQPVFTQSCATVGCHAGPSPAQGLDLSDGKAYGSTVGVTSSEVGSLLRVEAGNADSSYLIDKVEGTQTVGSMMPKTGGPLSSLEIQLIRTWINDGALDN